MEPKVQTEKNKEEKLKHKNRYAQKKRWQESVESDLKEETSLWLVKQIRYVGFKPGGKERGRYG